ncbi:glutamate receptor kainate-like protein [Dermatophagoides farinae]|uniref:Glutamate receptor kainate-like protein n=1 Tax=Dermatophagoides farinae TaxID=6954 RepID=A0A9D4NQI6_DERFA|nr:glutamate receptor kainate-like protein [Dermatophagoides farinae]
MNLAQQSMVYAKPNYPLLRGVTFRNWPYADRINDRYEGFVVDLMNLIAKKVGFEYRLYFSPDGKYGTEYNGNNINGMIGEVFRNRADFAIADLTVTDARKRYVDFTDAFLENQLAAIIRRDDAVGLRTLEDLVTLNEINHRQELPPTERQHLLTYGTYKTGATYFHLSKHRDPIARKIFEWMFRNPDALVRSAKEGFERVNAGRYAFIVESTFAEYLTGIYCNLTMLYDTRSLYPRRFAIALPKGSPLIQSFNKVIRELKATGTIERLRRQYWINRCSHLDEFNHSTLSSSTISPPQSSSSSTLPPAIAIPINRTVDHNHKTDDQLMNLPSSQHHNDGDYNHHQQQQQPNENKNQAKIEWSSHNRHYHPIINDRNNNPIHHHHRMNVPSSQPQQPPSHHHPHNRHHQIMINNNNRNKMNTDYDLDNDVGGGGGGGQYYSIKRSNGSSSSIRPSSSWWWWWSSAIHSIIIILLYRPIYR